MNERPASTARGLGDEVRRRRVALGLSQEALADRASNAGDEVRQSDISRLELGKVGLPRRPRLERLATALGMPVGELLARSGWAGAEIALAAADAPRASVPAPASGSAASTPAAAPAAPPGAALAVGDDWGRGGLGVEGNSRLREALAQSQAVRDRAKEALRRSAEVYDRAAHPPPLNQSRASRVGGMEELGSQ